MFLNASSNIARTLTFRTCCVLDGRCKGRRFHVQQHIDGILTCRMMLAQWLRVALLIEPSRVSFAHEELLMHHTAFIADTRHCPLTEAHKTCRSAPPTTASALDLSKCSTKLETTF